MHRDYLKIWTGCALSFSVISILCLKHHLKQIPLILESECMDRVQQAHGSSIQIDVNGRDVDIHASVPVSGDASALKTALESIPGMHHLKLSIRQETDSVKNDWKTYFQERFILFETNSTQLTDSARPLLDSLAGFINRDSSMHLMIRGWTDPAGDSLNNQILSEFRARNVRKALIRRNCDSTRLAIKGMGEQWPQSVRMPDSLARRVDFIMMEGNE